MPQKSLPPTPAGRLRVVHPALPVILTVMSMVLAVKLVPDKNELAKRQLKDGNHEHAIETAMELNSELQALAPSTPTVNPKEAQKALEEALLLPSKLRDLAASVDGRLLLAEGVLADEDITHRMAELCECAKELDTQDHEGMLLTVANLAKTRGQPKLTAMILSKWMQLRPEAMKADMIQGVVDGYAANNQPADALNCLKAWIDNQNAKRQEVPTTLQENYVSLLLANGRSAEALDLLLAKLTEQKQAGKISPATMATAIEAGNYCGRVKDLRPYLATSIANMPLGKASLEEICEAVKVPNHPLLTDRVQWSTSAMELAHWYEWSEVPDPSNAEQALALYEKLAVLGSRPALDKAADIAVDLQSTGNLLKVMDVVMADTKNLPQDMELIYGHLLGVAGRLDEADTFYNAWLKKNPTDLTAIAEYAALCQDKDDIPKALATWKSAADMVHHQYQQRRSYWAAQQKWLPNAELKAENVDYRKRQAEMHIEMQDNAEALAIYRAFQPHQHDNNTLENMALLAESLGDYVSLNQALAMRFKKIAHPSVNDYLELARSFDLISEDSQAINWLANGLAALPSSLNLRRKYASALQDVGRPGEAANVLEVESTKTDLRSMCIYIVASAESLNEERAAVFLRKQIGTRRDFPDDVKLCLGLICQKTGQLDLARGYLSSVDSNATTWPLLAEACFKTEAYRDAEKYQRLYLNDLDVAPADQLIFLGDICAQLGKEAEAQEAYNAAVESIRLKHNEAIEPSKAIETSPQPNISTSYSP